MQTVEILADSLNVETGDRITTFLLHKFPKCLSAELLTHRVFSRNSASSRAMPIKKVIEQITTDPFIPQWTSHQSGMQGGDKLSDLAKQSATNVWLFNRDGAIERVEQLIELGIAKQNANRLLEPWMQIPILVTATDWDNFFNLRCHPDTQPEFRAIAVEMKTEYDSNTQEEIEPGEWHIPFEETSIALQKKLKIATARAARLSYKTHLGEIDPEKDFELHDRLLDSKHLSPFEHCAKALPTKTYCRNFKGFMSYRVHLENEVFVTSEPTFYRPKQNA